jgi:elongation factor G
MGHQVDSLRTFTLLGHGGSGKTSLLDAMAYQAKVSPRHGSPADGTSISDNEPEEKARHHTLTSHLFRIPWNGRSLEMIDTPGHADFLADALCSLRAVETCIFVVDASTGVTFHTRRLWAMAREQKKGRVVVLTKADSDNVNLDEILDDIRAQLGSRVVPFNLPSGMGTDFKSVETCLQDGSKYRPTLEEGVAESDDALMEKYFAEGTLTSEEVEKNLPHAIELGTIHPLLTASGTSMIGIPELLDFISKDTPSPVQAVPRAAAKDPDGEYDIQILPDPAAPFVGLVFKVVSDPFVGKLSYIRCLRGTLKSDEGFTIARTGEHYKIPALLRVHGKDTADLDESVPGELFAVAKIEELHIGDTVCADAEVLHLPQFEVPSPMVAIAVNPKSRGDEQKIGPALEKLAAEDPCFRTGRDPDTGELLAEGLSKLHLDVIFGRLKERYKVELEQHEPRVPYRETVMLASQGHHRHKKQSGGRGQFGEVYLRIRPRDRGEGFEFADAIVGGSIPRQFIPEVEKGVRSMMSKGVIAGFPVVDCTVEVYDGKFHDVDSDQLSFQLAGGRAFMDAFEKGKPILLEPMMELEIHVPSRFTGDITSNLSNQRARMTGMDAIGDDQVIHASMPLKEARGYQSQLRSITAGEGSFSMHFSHFDPLPGNLQAEVVNAHKKEHD